jgi:hypothetical protein
MASGSRQSAARCHLPFEVPADLEAPMHRSRVNAVVTDVHFWIPVVVLVLGATLLLVLQ